MKFKQIKIVSSDDPNDLWAAAPDAHAGMATALYSTGNDILYSGGEDLNFILFLDCFI